MNDPNDWNKMVIQEFRANEGKVGGQFQGMTLLLLTHKGAKSGQTRVNPLVYKRDGDRLAVMASKGGAPTNPDWYHNLKAHPEVTVEVGADKFEAKAQEADPEERNRIYEEVMNAYPQFKDYEKNTTRIIPVMILEKV